MLKFRNIDATPDDPVEDWGVEGVLAAIERGGLVHVRKVMAAVRADPFGEVAADLLSAAAVTDNPVGRLMGAMTEQLRGGKEAQVAYDIRRAVAMSGTSLRRFAAQHDISPARLSNYANGKVMPSAATYLRLTSGTL